MFAILYALGMFVADLFKSRCRLEAENLLLRHQLAIALRRAPPPTVWRHYRHSNLVRAASPIRSDMIFGKDTRIRDVYAGGERNGCLIRSLTKQSYSEKVAGDKLATLRTSFSGQDGESLP